MSGRVGPLLGKLREVACCNAGASKRFALSSIGSKRSGAYSSCSRETGVRASRVCPALKYGDF
jgi:hypothetical protein